MAPPAKLAKPRKNGRRPAAAARRASRVLSSAKAYTKLISVAVESIPVMKENLRKAFEDLQPHSSSLASFTLQWKDIDDHFSGIKKSIEARLKEVESELKTMPANSLPAPENVSDKLEAPPKAELKSLCLKMDGKRLLNFIYENDFATIEKEIYPALLLAPDPAKLVLEALEGVDYSKPKGGRQIYRDARGKIRSCVFLLKHFHTISAEIKSSIKRKAKILAGQWKEELSYNKEYVYSLAFLRLLVSYDLASEFKPDEVLDVVVVVSRAKSVTDLCRSLGLGDKIPDLIEKLKGEGKPLNALKFVYAFDLVDKFPPVPLLKAHVRNSKKIAREVRKRGRNSTGALNDAIDREITALKAVIRAIEELKLESKYSSGKLNKRIAELQQQKVQKKQKVPPTAALDSKSQEQPSKRPRTSSTIVSAVATPPASSTPAASRTPATSVPAATRTPAASTTPAASALAATPAASVLAAATPAASVPPTATSVVMARPRASLSHPQHLHGSTNGAQYLSSAWPFGPSGGSAFYSRVPQSPYEIPLAMGANQIPTVPYPYPLDALRISGLQTRPMYYGGYPPSGGLPSQFNPYLYQ